MAEIFKILHSFHTLQEHQMANLCLHPIFPKGYGTHGHGSGTHTLGHGTRSLVKTNLCCVVLVFFFGLGHYLSRGSGSPWP